MVQCTPNSDVRRCEQWSEHFVLATQRWQQFEQHDFTPAYPRNMAKSSEGQDTKTKSTVEFKVLLALLCYWSNFNAACLREDTHTRTQGQGKYERTTICVGRVALGNSKRQWSLITHDVTLLSLHLTWKKVCGSRLQHWRALGTLVKLNDTRESGAAKSPVSCMTNSWLAWKTWEQQWSSAIEQKTRWHAEVASVHVSRFWGETSDCQPVCVMMPKLSEYQRQHHVLYSVWRSDFQLPFIRADTEDQLRRAKLLQRKPTRGLLWSVSGCCSTAKLAHEAQTWRPTQPERLGKSKCKKADTV